MATAKYGDFVLYRRVLGHVRPYWLHLTGILLLSLLSPPLALLNPLRLKIAVDSVIGRHPLPRFLLLSAKAANAHEFTIRPPRGYETQVGERGMRLSEGEGQRIS